MDGAFLISFSDAAIFILPTFSCTLTVTPADLTRNQTAPSSGLKKQFILLFYHQKVKFSCAIYIIKDRCIDTVLPREISRYYAVSIFLPTPNANHMVRIRICFDIVSMSLFIFIIQESTPVITDFPLFSLPNRFR